MKTEIPALSISEQIAAIRRILGPNHKGSYEESRSEIDLESDESVETDLYELIQSNY